MVSCASFWHVGDSEHTRRTLDCRDSHFPTNKGPKYLQYSNSLNDTSIFHFIQLFSAMSSMFHHIYIHSCVHTGPFNCFEVFLKTFLATVPFIIVLISPGRTRSLPRACHGSIRHSFQSRARSRMPQKWIKVTVLLQGFVTLVKH